MYTKAAVAKHPIHPMLIAFPVALYTATVVGLIVHAVTRDPFWYRAAFWTNVAGIVMAGVAAIPGFIDLLSLPRHTKALATGLRHAAFNVLALVLFAISAIILGRNWFGPALVLDTGAPLVLGIVGLMSTVVAGALGWTLVQTHHVGVKPTQHHVARPPGEIDDLDELIVPPTTVSDTGEPAYPMHH
jgi:uncharacterized membrane protein